MNSGWLLLILLFSCAVIVSAIALWVNSRRGERECLYYWGVDGPMVLRDGKSKRLTGTQRADENRDAVTRAKGDSK